jgi:hypothetical protein
MSNTNALKAALARSLDTANRRPRASPSRAPRRPAPDTSRRKLSVSLFPRDVTQLEAVRDALAKAGHRVTASTAIQIALREVKASASLASHLREIAAEDRRRAK